MYISMHLDFLQGNPTMSTEPTADALLPPPRLLDLLRHVARQHFGQGGPGDRFADWTRRLIHFHDKRHPRELSSADVGRFLHHVAHTEKEPLACIDQAHAAFTFLYQNVLHLEIGEWPMPEPPRLLDRLRWACRVRHYSSRTEDCYVGWVDDFIRFHGMRHPTTMGAAEIESYLTDLAVNQHVAASTQNQAFYALLFLYQQVLGVELPRLDAVRHRRPKRLPRVLSVEEVRIVLDAVQPGRERLMTRLLYGTGLRREECCTIRVCELDLHRFQLRPR